MPPGGDGICLTDRLEPGMEGLGKGCSEEKKWQTRTDKEESPQPPQALKPREDPGVPGLSYQVKSQCHLRYRAVWASMSPGNDNAAWTCQSLASRLQIHPPFLSRAPCYPQAVASATSSGLSEAWCVSV